jgi:hypothetical protein
MFTGRRPGHFCADWSVAGSEISWSLAVSLVLGIAIKSSNDKVTTIKTGRVVYVVIRIVFWNAVDVSWSLIKQLYEAIYNSLEQLTSY